MTAPYPCHGGIDAHGMNGGADSHAGDYGQQRQQHLRAIGSHNRQQQAEYADRSQAHNDVDNLVADFGSRIEPVDEDLRLLAAYLQDAHAYEQGKDDDRQDVSLGHGGYRIGRNHGNQHLHDGRCFLDLYRLAGSHLQADAGMSHTGYGKADNDGDCRGAEVNQDGLDTDASQLFQVTQAGHAHNQ